MNHLISRRNFQIFRGRNNDNIFIDKSNSRTRNNSSKFRSSDVWKRSRFVILSLLPVNFRFERNQLKLNLSILTHCWNDDFRLRGMSLSEKNLTVLSELAFSVAEFVRSSALLILMILWILIAPKRKTWYHS